MRSLIEQVEAEAAARVERLHLVVSLRDRIARLRLRDLRDIDHHLTMLEARREALRMRSFEESVR